MYTSSNFPSIVPSQVLLLAINSHFLDSLQDLACSVGEGILPIPKKYCSKFRCSICHLKVWCPQSLAQSQPRKIDLLSQFATVTVNLREQNTQSFPILDQAALLLDQERLFLLHSWLDMIDLLAARGFDLMKNNSALVGQFGYGAVAPALAWTSFAPYFDLPTFILLLSIDHFANLQHPVYPYHPYLPHCQRAYLLNLLLLSKISLHVRQ